ncbi:uncharacterized protein DUF3788 [Breznakia blatticola]|uniref:Uncharacterized protein DUF3788 n=1 Tax=Breznakia blatticola TaxID=1754012 RepID=A0A4R8A9I3_9FIRM|nr:DUF3788 family protein [Breznakia blatticola]TDW26371.1 uncharacterized protein DUF3788 [Breznakia blatticola]
MEKLRLVNKDVIPTSQEIHTFIGNEAFMRLQHFEQALAKRYALQKELKFPFGSSYGWAYRYAHKKTLLLYIFFEANGFCCTVSLNDKAAPKMETLLPNLQPKTQELWQNRYPCGEQGGWIHDSITSDEDIEDILQLVATKVKPKNV